MFCDPISISMIYFQIECAVYNPEHYLSSENDPDTLSMHHGFLWVSEPF